MSEATFEAPTGRPKVGTIKHPGRSRITNGTAFLPVIDGRSAWIRRAKDLISEHLSDLGGPDNTSAAERSITRRVARFSLSSWSISKPGLPLLTQPAPRISISTNARRRAYAACSKQLACSAARVT
jgi:hypothetical protein